MNCPYIPPFPEPPRDKLSLLKRFMSGRHSWIDVLSERSYRMLAGKVRMPRGSFYVVNDKEQISRIMNKEPHAFPKHRMLADTLEPLLGESIFTTNGKQWTRQRAMMSAAFAQTALRKAYPQMQQSIADMLKRVDTYCSTDDAVHIDVEMTHVTADIIFRTILSKSLSATQADIIFNAFHTFQERAMTIMNGRAYFKPTGRLQRENDRCAAVIRDALAPDVTARHRAFRAGDIGDYDDILQALLKATCAETGHVFSAEELIDQVSMLFLAGHETSASALTWALYIAADRPEFQERLHKEAMSASEGFDGIRSLSFTKNFFRETLRLYPPVGFFLRESAQAATIRTHKVKKGAGVFIAPWLLHRSPREWDNPHVFDPERFADGSLKDSVKHAYIPFGCGARICIGAGFATQEALLVLSALMKRYRFVPKKGHIPMPVGRVTVRPENGVYLHITPRDISKQSQDV